VPKLPFSFPPPRLGFSLPPGFVPGKEYEFRAMTTSLVICVDACKFVVPGVGTVTATRDDIVTIENGKMSALKVPVVKPPSRKKGR